LNPSLEWVCSDSHVLIAIIGTEFFSASQPWRITDLRICSVSSFSVSVCISCSRWSEIGRKLATLKVSSCWVLCAWKVCTTKEICNMHFCSLFVTNFQVVLLQPRNHSLQVSQCACKWLLEDCFTGFVVTVDCDVSSKCKLTG